MIDFGLFHKQQEKEPIVNVFGFGINVPIVAYTIFLHFILDEVWLILINSLVPNSNRMVIFPLQEERLRFPPKISD